MTKDLDLGVDLGYFAGRIFSATELEQTLREDLASMAEDDFTFTVPQTAAQSLPIQGVQAYRFTVEARLDGRGFDTIKVDVGLGDPLLPPLEELSGSDLLSFAEIPVVTIRVTSWAQQFAEKVHALTRPFDDRVNTRVKDLADIMLLMNLGLPDPSSVMTVITEIFDARKSHTIPKQIQEAPSTWWNSFAAIAKELNIAEAKETFAAEIAAGRLTLVAANFESLASGRERCPAGFDFILFDLGVSSPQLDSPERGFSFYNQGPLDMRRDPSLKRTAADVIRESSVEELVGIFRELGEVERPYKVVRAIASDRKLKPFVDTVQLSGLIERVDGWAKKGFHPATQYFMALRLFVNRELEVIESALPAAVESLRPGGRMAVITFLILALVSKFCIKPKLTVMHNATIKYLPNFAN